MATSCTDKSLSVYDYHTGELMASMCGHSELVTGLAFSNDSRHLISVSGDSCVFVWRLPTEMVATMQVLYTSSLYLNYFLYLICQARVAAQSNRQASSRTYIGSGSEEFGSPPPEFFEATASNPVPVPANDNDPYR